MERKKLTIRERWKSKTPRFWKKIQRFSIVLGAISGAILTAPISLPAILITTAGYLAVTSTAIAGMSQLTKSDRQKTNKNG
tara:strand:+ start:6073 stop:6315 length:243 start_codon:yes stop_codon:yes gene_type:complete